MSEETAEANDEAMEESKDAVEAPPSRRTRRKRLFPNMSFEEALFLPNAIQRHASGQEVRRLTLFEALKRSPDSGPTRKLVTASGQYGLTTGSFSADVLALTSAGASATDPAVPEVTKTKARIELAVLAIPPFKAIFDKYSGGRLPEVSVMRDAASEAGVPEDDVAECVETFLANARFVGLIRKIAGTEHLVSVDDALDQLPTVPQETTQSEPREGGEAVVVAPRFERAQSTSNPEGMDDVCFIISPIGHDDSEERKHADLVLGALIEPALESLGLRAIRADKISKPGLITGQVLDHLTRARIVIADLSFGNPNVYYELALRQALRKPLVQITRSADKLPFDVGQFRTVVIDMTDIYTLVPALDLHRQEISRQCRAALEDGDGAESPISRFYPNFWEYLPTD
ncbi:MAG: hypothetical protein LCH60_06765 [Actinobacteria bacterium]|nr:hypothetical protein [Actinomycetota bacterium]